MFSARLKVELSKTDKNGTLTWLRTYEEGQLVEMVSFVDKKKQQHVRVSHFTNWFWKRDFPGLLEDYKRWGWKIIEYSI